MDALSIKHHIEHLEELHRNVDIQIRETQKHYGEDNAVTTLKKKKLRIKDQIEYYKDKQTNASNS